MPSPSGHTSAIPASRLNGTNVYNSAGDKIGNTLATNGEGFWEPSFGEHVSSSSTPGKNQEPGR
jgi:hypothetical protein